jgi:hypothetical protein
VKGCPRHYSPGFGYFTLEENLEQQDATGVPALRIRRSATQVICGHHMYCMFLERFDPATDVANFRCPEKDCGCRMAIAVDGPPAYWFSEGYFKTA